MSSRHLFFHAARQLRSYLWWRHSREEEAKVKESVRLNFADLGKLSILCIHSKSIVGEDHAGFHEY